MKTSIHQAFYDMTTQIWFAAQPIRLALCHTEEEKFTNSPIKKNCHFNEK